MTETEKLYKDNILFGRSKSGIILESIVSKVMEQRGYTIDRPEITDGRTVSSTEYDFMMTRDEVSERVEVKSSFLLFKGTQWRIRYNNIKKDLHDVLMLVACYTDEIIVYRYDKNRVRTACVEFSGKVNELPEATQVAIKAKLENFKEFVINYE